MVYQNFKVVVMNKFILKKFCSEKLIDIIYDFRQITKIRFLLIPKLQNSNK